MCIGLGLWLMIFMRSQKKYTKMEEHSGLQNTLSIALLNSLQSKWTQDFVSSYACPAVLDCAFWSAETSQESHPSKILTLALVPEKLHETWVYNTCIQICNIDKAFVETQYPNIVHMLLFSASANMYVQAKWSQNRATIHGWESSFNVWSCNINIYIYILYIYIWIMCLSNSPV